MKIAMVGTRGIVERYSGIEVYLTELSKRLARNGHEIIIYCRKTKSYHPESIMHKNIQLVFIPTINSKHFGTIIHTFFSLVHVLRTDVTIVHFHALGPSFLSFLPRLFGKKTVVTVQGLDWKRKKWKWFARLFLKLCEYTAITYPNKTIVVSKTLQNYFENKYKKQVHYIPNGIEIPSDAIQREAYNTQNKCILFVGRLVPEKGIHILIKAFNDLHSNNTLMIVGKSSFTDKYVSYLKDIAHKNVHFIGPVQESKLAELYTKALIFVLPSEVEGLSLALLEAMCFGCCTVVSDIPENMEVIGNCGVSFNVGNYRDLHAQLNYLITHPEKAIELGRKGKERIIKKYNVDDISHIMEKLYISLISQS